MSKSYKVRVRNPCARYDFRLRKRVFDTFEERSFETIKECVGFIDESLKSNTFFERYHGYKLRIEILEDYEVIQFIVIHIGRNKVATYLFSSDESTLPLKDEYYHEREASSI